MEGDIKRERMRGRKNERRRRTEENRFVRRIWSRLTVEQHMKTMMKEPKTPPMPTIQVIRRNKITPKMFCRHGRYTPMNVPIWGDWDRHTGE